MADSDDEFGVFRDWKRRRTGNPGYHPIKQFPSRPLSPFPTSDIPVVLSAASFYAFFGTHLKWTLTQTIEIVGLRELRALNHPVVDSSRVFLGALICPLQRISTAKMAMVTHFDHPRYSTDEFPELDTHPYTADENDVKSYINTFQDTHMGLPVWVDAHISNAIVNLLGDIYGDVDMIPSIHLDTTTYDIVEEKGEDVQALDFIVDLTELNWKQVLPQHTTTRTPSSDAICEQLVAVEPAVQKLFPSLIQFIPQQIRQLFTAVFFHPPCYLPYARQWQAYSEKLMRIRNLVETIRLYDDTKAFTQPLCVMNIPMCVYEVPMHVLVLYSLANNHADAFAVSQVATFFQHIATHNIETAIVWPAQLAQLALDSTAWHRPLTYDEHGEVEHRVQLADVLGSHYAKIRRAKELGVLLNDCCQSFQDGGTNGVARLAEFRDFDPFFTGYGYFMHACALEHLLLSELEAIVVHDFVASRDAGVQSILSTELHSDVVTNILAGYIYTPPLVPDLFTMTPVRRYLVFSREEGRLYEDPYGELDEELMELLAARDIVVDTCDTVFQMLVRRAEIRRQIVQYVRSPTLALHRNCQTDIILIE